MKKKVVLRRGAVGDRRSRRLRVSKETIRVLTDDEAKNVAGGITGEPTCSWDPGGGCG